MKVDAVSFGAAVIVLLLGHAVRAVRWSLLFPNGSQMPRVNLLLALSSGYFVNTLVPFRLGELLRILIVNRRENIRFSFVAATVVLERLTDLAVVGVLFAVILVGFRDNGWAGWGLPTLMLGFAALGVAFAVAVRRSFAARRAIWSLASIFNPRISVAIADFFWVYSEILLSRIVIRWQYLMTTLLMWFLYLLSYRLFAGSVGVSTIETTAAMLGRPVGALAASFGTAQGQSVGLMFLAFSIIPLVIVIAYALLRDHRHVGRVLHFLRERQWDPSGSPAVVQDRFRAPEAYNRFLSDMFEGNDLLVTSFWREALGDCVLHRFYNGGSDAVTALVEADGRLLIRKFASGKAGDKLRDQADWLLHHRGDGLPLVEIEGQREMNRLYSYDMPLVTPSNDFFDVVHTSDWETVQRTFVAVLDAIEDFHDRHATAPASDEVIRAYLAQKVKHNAELIIEFARREIGSETFEINGKTYGLAALERLTDIDWAYRQVSRRETTIVHGDLTIENIISAPDLPGGFYFIDPNPDNIFNSPLIDWAKLMQSVHLGYETLNRGMVGDFDSRSIKLHASRSYIYSRLHALLLEEFARRKGTEALQDLHFHELVNYLRLTTYKIRQNRARGIGFFACTNIVLDEYLNRWT